MKRLFALLIVFNLLVATAVAETTLTIREGSESVFLDQYLTRHTDVEINSLFPQLMGDAFASDVLTNPVYDLYEMTYGTTFIRLMEEGYLMPIEDQASIAWLEAAYPPLVEALTYEGKLYGIPTPSDSSSGIIVWAYVPENLEDAGLTELPSTWIELLNMMADWDPDNPYRLFGNDSVPMLVEMIVDDYILRYESLNEPLSFDTPAFRETMEALLRWHRAKPPVEIRPPLLQTLGIYFGEEDGGLRDDMRLIPPVTFLPDETPIVTFDLFEVWGVSRRTKNADVAMNLIAEAVEFMPEQICYETIPDAIQPRENCLNQQTVDNINEVMQYVKINSVYVIGGKKHEFMDAINRYLDGNLPLDMLVKQLDNVVEMITLERN